ncbi:hypothetical protein JCM8115_003606 [Rhodotorula mucilaginosa]
MHGSRSLASTRQPRQPDAHQQATQTDHYRARSDYSALPAPGPLTNSAPSSSTYGSGSAPPPFASTSTLHAFLPPPAPPASLSYATPSSIPAPRNASGGNMSSFRQPCPSSTPSYLSYSGSVLPAPPPFIAPREPAPLFDSNESALLSTFLTTLDVDPNFLFNPVLPPGMPSPPPPDRNLTTYGMDARDRWERELRAQYGARVEGNGNGGPPASTAAVRTTTVRRIPDLPNSEDEDDADAPDDVPVKDEMDDDPDFEPRSRSSGGHSGRGARKKAAGGRGGGAAVTAAGGRGSAKKARVSTAKQAPPQQQQQFDDVDGDVEMADTASSSTPGLTASGRPKRNARPPRRLSGTNGTAAVPVPGSSATPAPPTSARSAPRPPPSKTSLASLSSSLPALPDDAISQHHQPLHAYPPPHPQQQQQQQYLQHQYPPHGPSHAGVPLPHGADFMMSGPLSPGLDELPEPPASSYADTQLGAGSIHGPSGRGDAEGSPASSSNATPTGTERGGSGGGAGRAAPLTDSQKRSNHILSEQKRRNAIRSGFKDLVDFLVAGEAASGIILGPPGSSSQSLQQQQQQEAAAQAQADEEAAANGKKRKGKGTGRGRGRRGDAGANASKSVVLTRAADYILWLERGNRALENEIERLEAAAAAANGGA